MSCHIALSRGWTDHSPKAATALARRLSSLIGSDITVEAVRLAAASTPAPGSPARHQERPPWLPAAVDAAVTITSTGSDARATQTIREALDTPDAWEVSRQVMIDLVGARDRPSIARFGFLTRPAAMDPATFGEHWLRRHAPIVVRNGPLFRRYEAHLARCDSPVLAWDGVVVQWFADQADWNRHDELIATTKDAVREDIPRFVGSAYQYLASDFVIGRSAD